MLGFIIGYLLGSPSVYTHKCKKEVPLNKKQRLAIARKHKHDKTCPNISHSEVSHREVMQDIFW